MNLKKLGVTVISMAVGSGIAWLLREMSEAALLVMWGGVLLALTTNTRVGRIASATHPAALAEPRTQSGETLLAFERTV